MSLREYRQHAADFGPYYDGNDALAAFDELDPEEQAEIQYAQDCKDDLESLMNWGR